jgi:hypothetical protein
MAVKHLRHHILRFYKHRENVKLHLGCGYNYLNGYVNIDSSHAVRADYYLNIASIKSFFKANSVDEVLMSHVIGYFNLFDARILFKDLYDLLKTNGILVLEFPDVQKSARILLNSNGEEGYIEAIRAFYAFDKTQLKNGEKYMPYKFGWSANYLGHELSKVGFVIIEKSDCDSHSLPNRDSKVIAKKP